jgi:hypothetical protein
MYNYVYILASPPLPPFCLVVVQNVHGKKMTQHGTQIHKLILRKDKLFKPRELEPGPNLDRTQGIYSEYNCIVRNHRQYLDEDLLGDWATPYVAWATHPVESVQGFWQKRKPSIPLFLETVEGGAFSHCAALHLAA